MDDEQENHLRHMENVLLRDFLKENNWNIDDFTEEVVIEMDKNDGSQYFSKLGNKDIIMFLIEEIPIFFWITLVQGFFVVLFTIQEQEENLFNDMYVSFGTNTVHMVP